MLKPGKKLGPFRIEREIGRGSMGTVYRAHVVMSEQQVAIKVVAASLSNDAEAIARFEREAEILKQLRHPNIVRIVGSGRYRGSPFYAMEYVDGIPLDRLLKRKSQFSWREVVDIGMQLCDALQYAHEKGIVHRDLKPSNLILLLDGTIKLADFGIARHLELEGQSRSDLNLGTAAYMSPEQCRGDQNLSHKSDLYSLGVVLYELATGTKPFTAESTMDWYMQHLNATPDPPRQHAPHLPRRLNDLILHLLQKKPADRPHSAAEVRATLAAIRRMPIWRRWLIRYVPPHWRRQLEHRSRALRAKAEEYMGKVPKWRLPIDLRKLVLVTVLFLLAGMLAGWAYSTFLNKPDVPDEQANPQSMVNGLIKQAESFEQRGRIDLALDLWRKVRDLSRTETVDDDAVAGAEARIKEIEPILDYSQRLGEKIRRERGYRGRSMLEHKAVQALRAEQAKKTDRAIRYWEELLQRTQGEDRLRFWQLLARYRLAVLRTDDGSPRPQPP